MAASGRLNAESAYLFARPHWMLTPWRQELTRRKNEVFPIVRAAVNALRHSAEPNGGLIKQYVSGDFVTSNDDEMLTILVGLLMGTQDNRLTGIPDFAPFAHSPRNCVAQGMGLQQL